MEILKLAAMPKGVSPAELNTLTKWRGAPWKWLFSNPKKIGHRDRWGFKFEVLSDKDDARAVRYHARILPCDIAIISAIDRKR